MGETKGNMDRGWKRKMRGGKQGRKQINRCVETYSKSYSSQIILVFCTAFGSIESPIVTGTVPPPNSLTRQYKGKMKGIQGHHNSCYLDSTLYSMFSFTTVFDSLLHRAKKADDLEQYDVVQLVLKEFIVNPLRR